MGAREIVVRGTRLGRHRLDDLQWARARPLWRRRWRAPEIDGLEIERPLGFLTAERAREVWARDPDGAKALVARADEVLDGRTRAFGRLLELPADVGVDPLTGYRWPDVHSKRIDYRTAPANPKWVWEIERCQDVSLLTGAWLATGDESYAEGAASSIERWARAHTPGRGIAWPNGFEAGLRAISLATAFDGLAAEPALRRRLSAVVLGTLWQHGRWIERDPSTHSSANNHRIGELVGLLAIGKLAPELPEAQSWAQRALAELRVEAERQILLDGTGAEQSYAYTLFVLDLLLVASALLDATGVETPGAILDALGRASAALWAQIGEDEPELDYGDRDDGRALGIDGNDERGARAVAASLCARLGNPYARAVAGELDATAVWLFGASGSDRFTETVPAERPGSLVLGNAGLAILRSADTRVTFDAGPLGYLTLGAHGHSDALSVTVTSDGMALVVDPGTGTYFGGASHVRNAFRGTGFHATVIVDDVDQSASGGPFLWLRHARSWFSRFDPAVVVAAGEHDGYQSLVDPVRHRRVVHLLAADRLLVYDRLDAGSEHTAAVRWPLSQDLVVRIEGASRAGVNRDGSEVLQVCVAATGAGALLLAHGSDAPFAGWVSPRLEELVPGPLLMWQTRFTRRLDIATLLDLRRDSRSHPTLDIRVDEELVEIVVTVGTARTVLHVDASGGLTTSTAGRRRT